MVTSIRRHAALALSVCAVLVVAHDAAAQVQPVSTAQGAGFVGIPEHTSKETGIPFFSKNRANKVDAGISGARQAIADCNRAAYDAWNARYRSALNEEVPFAPYEPGNSIARAQDSKDIDNVWRGLKDNFPAYPEPCRPQSAATDSPLGPWTAVLIGGGTVALNSSGNVTGVDSFFGSGNFLIDNRSNGASSSIVPLLGGRIRHTWQEQDNWNYVRDRTLSDYWKRASFFVESGVQTSFGAQSFLQSFGGVSGVPQGFGSNTVKENFQIPVLIGVGLPLTGPSQPPVFLDLYGGITLDSWSQTLQGREAGAPGAAGFFNQSNRFTVDPTIGGGVRMVVNDFKGSGVPALVIGVGAELSFRPGSVVQAQSSNFPSETYYGTVNAQANLSILARIGIPFGGTR